MKNNFKILFAVGLPFFSLALIASFFLPQTQNISVQAQGGFTSDIICDEPIPLGKTIEDAKSLLKDVYEEYQNTLGYLTSVIDHVTSETTELFKNPEEVCDFTLCSPSVIDRGFDSKLKIAGFEIPGHVPLCENQECIGDPCPDLSKYVGNEGSTGSGLGAIRVLKSAIDGSYERIRDIFNTPTIPLIDELRKEGESVEFITKPDLVERELLLSRQWLHPTTGPKRSCSLSDMERMKVEEGEMGDVYPMRCVDALNETTYWPRVWSEVCQIQCQEGPTDTCKNCLRTSSPDEKSSPLSWINYKIYQTCSTDCDDQFSPQCVVCLCDGKTEKECTAWLCGGSYYNYVCCHETPLEIE